MKSSRWLLGGACCLGLTAIGWFAGAEVADLEAAARSGGAFTVPLNNEEAYSSPAPVLTYKQLERFMRGRVAFNARWVVAPSLAGEWGLGPVFIAESCAECHVKAGRGRPPESPDEQLFSVLVRLSIPGEDEHHGPKPHPNYGDQLQNSGLEGKDPRHHLLGKRVPPEGAAYVDWEERVETLGDGETVRLRVPKLRIQDLNFGPLGPEVMTSLRMAQPVFGLGLLEAVPEQTLLEIARKQAAVGVNGRPNHVWDMVNKRITVGRFGWKANQPSVKQQIVSAFHGDLGATSSLIPYENCMPVQTACRAQPPGNNPEVIDEDLDNLVFWTQGLAVPARRDVNDPVVRRGEQLFGEARCAVCHVAGMTTGEFPLLPQLSNQTFHAYTDLLLHDMGDGLADGRPDFKAGPRDWRTQPLWGIGLSAKVNGSTAMLHDGRARNFTEAIVWHDGEATASREAFRAMPRSDREALLRFLGSL